MLHVVGAQLWDVVDGADAVSAAAVVVVAGEDLAGRLAAEVPGGGRPAAHADAGGRGEAEHGEETGQEEQDQLQKQSATLPQPVTDSEGTQKWHGISPGM